MLITFELNSAPADVEAAVAFLRTRGCEPSATSLHGLARIVVPVMPPTIDVELALSLRGVATVSAIDTPYKLAARDAALGSPPVRIAGRALGRTELFVIAGPCAVESEEQIVATARAVRDAGATFLRGGGISPEPALTIFKDCARTRSVCSRSRGTKRACASSPKPAMSRPYRTWPRSPM